MEIYTPSMNKKSINPLYWHTEISTVQSKDTLNKSIYIKLSANFTAC